MTQYSDLGSLMPSKSAYVNPGEYEATQRNIALEKGTYMASMDQYYAGIEESARQFDLTHDLAERTFEFESEQTVAEFLEGIRQFDVETLLADRELDIKAISAGAQATQSEAYAEGVEHDTDFDWYGLAVDTFKEGGLWDSIFG